MVSPAAVSVPDLLRSRAESSPEDVALMLEDGRTLTYGQWDRYSDTAARGLAEHGVRSGDLIALLFDNARWDAYAVAYLGAHKAGCTAVPLSPQVGGPELSGIMDHCGAVGVVCPPDLVPSDPLGEVWTASLADLKALSATRDSGELTAPMSDGSALAEVIYTSGTTAAPKGVACSHASIVIHDGPPEPEGARAKLLHAFPVGTNACQELMRVSLRRGDRIPVAMAGFDPERCAALVERLRIARMQLVPSMARSLVDSDMWARHDMSCVEVITLSSSPAPPALIARLADAFPRARLVNAYALTESGTARSLNLDARSKPDSLGYPVGRTEIRIAGESGGALDAGQVGEIWLRHPAAPQRYYLHDPQASAVTWAGGWLHTGDLGYLDAKGELYLVDRLKDIIICGGLNVSSLEIEAVVAGHPAVREVAVLGAAHEVLGQDVAAAVVRSGPLDARELQAFARRSLPEHKVPHRIAFLDTLPRGPSGKVRKRDLETVFDTWAGGRGDRRSSNNPSLQGYAPPSTHEEEVIATIWTEVLGTERVGIHDDFFEIGGHSLAAARMLARIEEVLGVSMTLTDIFEGPTVAELASAVIHARVAK